ncbi:type III secretion system outer membrane ring subunit SctC [Vibrio sp. TBV020]|uniref:type III secretion system outer membrane ring subunit SctC n=1 Tax=Vibrio sp. TBV020 TaxID=3137398 RepID=UPI0038CD6B7D
MDNKYSYRAQNKPLFDVLNAFSAHYKILGVVSDCLKEPFNGNLSSNNGEDFLNKLSSAYNFIWFKIDSVIYFNCLNEIQTKTISLEAASSVKFQEKMDQIGLSLDRFGLSILPDTNMLLVSGPPKYLDIILNAAKEFDKHIKNKTDTQMKPYVIKLKHINVQDKELNNGSTELGIVSQLKNLLGYNKDDYLGNMVPVPTSNKLLIYDTELSIKNIIQLVEHLDKPRYQIEISVSIIDIAENALENLGVDWSSAGQHGSIETNSLEGIIKGLWQTGTTTLSSNSVNYFQFALTALEQQHKAKTLARPTILAQENTRSLISNKEEFYAKVEAKEDAQLVTLSAGTELVVIPRVISFSSGLAINLDINITDGIRKNETISDLPVITQGRIITQATVKEDQSLLIGGFYTKSYSSRVSKVPVMGDIPVLGSFFQYSHNNDKRNLRLFLIKPKLLEPYHSDSQKISKLSKKKLPPELDIIINAVGNVEQYYDMDN